MALLCEHLRSSLWSSGAFFLSEMQQCPDGPGQTSIPGRPLSLHCFKSLHLLQTNKALKHSSPRSTKASKGGKGQGQRMGDWKGWPWRWSGGNQTPLMSGGSSCPDERDREKGASSHHPAWNDAKGIRPGRSVFGRPSRYPHDPIPAFWSRISPYRRPLSAGTPLSASHNNPSSFRLSCSISCNFSITFLISLLLRIPKTWNSTLAQDRIVELKRNLNRSVFGIAHG